MRSFLILSFRFKVFNSLLPLKLPFRLKSRNLGLNSRHIRLVKCRKLRDAEFEGLRKDYIIRRIYLLKQGGCFAAAEDKTLPLLY
jgi:hypothetical protein